jgi:CRP-like cAMP-binding protein
MIGLIQNVRTGSISPQFHVVYDRVSEPPALAMALLRSLMHRVEQRNGQLSYRANRR